MIETRNYIIDESANLTTIRDPIEPIERFFIREVIYKEEGTVEIV